MTHRILFVCLGNICRSPTAEGVFRAMAAEAGLAVEVDSCGTGGWHAGEAPHPPAIAAAGRRGYDLTGLRARQIDVWDFARFHRILVMDRANLRDVQEVPDPWYTGEYDRVLDMIEDASRGLIAALRRGQPAQ